MSRVRQRSVCAKGEALHTPRHEPARQGKPRPTTRCRQPPYRPAARFLRRMLRYQVRAGGAPEERAGRARAPTAPRSSALPIPPWRPPLSRLACLALSISFWSASTGKVGGKCLATGRRRPRRRHRRHRRRRRGASLRLAARCRLERHFERPAKSRLEAEKAPVQQHLGSDSAPLSPRDVEIAAPVPTIQREGPVAEAEELAHSIGAPSTEGPADDEPPEPATRNLAKARPTAAAAATAATTPHAAAAGHNSQARRHALVATLCNG